MPFSQPVATYMATALEVVRVDGTLDEVAAVLEDRRISALPVLGHDGTVVGVLSRTDLVRAGLLRAGGVVALDLSARWAHDLMSQPPLVCTPATSLRDAARLMLHHRVHRLFVVDETWPVGVISTLDLTTAVRDARLEATIETIMTSPVVTVPVTEPMKAAVARLERSQVSALVVVDDGWPVGLFGQREALAARDLDPTTATADVMDPAVICLPARTSLHYAAALAANLDVRRVIVSANQEMIGIVSGMDFARVVAAAPAPAQSVGEPPARR